MNKTYMTELSKLATSLVIKGIPFKFKKLHDGYQIIVANLKHGNEWEWDAICHSGSYGHETGLLEIMGTIVDLDKTCGDEVEGWLTAKDILERL